MPKQTTPPPDMALPPGDPRRPLKIARLRDAKARISEFAAREPLFDDPEFKEWEHAVLALLQELFGASNYLLRFRKLTIRDIRSVMGRGSYWGDAYRTAWPTGLKQAERLLGEALEEAAIELPTPESGQSRKGSPASPVVVNINNVFSPSFHVTLPELLSQLDQLPLTTPERALATEELQTLDAEAKGQQRWGVLGRHMDALKSVGKGAYEKNRNSAVP